MKKESIRERTASTQRPLPPVLGETRAKDLFLPQGLPKPPPPNPYNTNIASLWRPPPIEEKNGTVLSGIAVFALDEPPPGLSQYGFPHSHSHSGQKSISPDRKIRPFRNETTGKAGESKGKRESVGLSWTLHRIWATKAKETVGDQGKKKRTKEKEKGVFWATTGV